MAPPVPPAAALGPVSPSRTAGSTAPIGRPRPAGPEAGPPAAAAAGRESGTTGPVSASESDTWTGAGTATSTGRGSGTGTWTGSGEICELAHFLRSRRARLTPEAAGLPRTSTRRLNGLRRAEVATLAGISPEYYTRLEQGRQCRPSPAVLDALAGALRLDEDARRHLHRLATAAPGPRSGPDGGPGLPELPEGTRRLLASLTPWPAHVVTPMRDVIAWNRAEAWLLPALLELPAAHRNHAWFVFCDPRAHALLPDWEQVARGNVHRLRHALAADPRNPRGNRLVAELISRSRRFAEIWEEHDVRGPAEGHHAFLHAEAGRLDLDYTAYVVPGTPALELVVLTAPEGSPTHRALLRAGSGA